MLLVFRSVLSKQLKYVVFALNTNTVAVDLENPGVGGAIMWSKLKVGEVCYICRNLLSQTLEPP